MDVQNSTTIGADQNLRSILQLALTPGVGPRMYQVLVTAFGTPAAVLASTPSHLLRVAGVGPKTMQSIVEASVDVEPVIEICQKHDISILLDGQSDYPRLLHEIPDPPGALFTAGKLLPQDTAAIAIVGTRHATHYGKKQARRLGAGLARAGMTIVSGLARGVDAEAHRGALEAGGRTIAVLASGVLNIYPAEHQQLAKEIHKQGAVVSENPPLTVPKSGMFPQRNRIITGMSLGVVVIEAAARSGALISAWHAMDQNREVFAVPGRIDSRTSRGCHQLLREGAKLVEGPDDVLEELGPLVQPVPTKDGREIRQPAELQLNVQEQRVLDAIDTEPTAMDPIVARSGLPIQRVLATISVLETRHLVRRVSGNVVVRI